MTSRMQVTEKQQTLRGGYTRYRERYFIYFKRLAHHFLSYPGDDSLEMFNSLSVLGRTAVGIVDGVVPAVLVQATQVFLAGRRGHDQSRAAGYER